MLLREIRFMKLSSDGTHSPAGHYLLTRQSSMVPSPEEQPHSVRSCYPGRWPRTNTCHLSKVNSLPTEAGLARIKLVFASTSNSITFQCSLEVGRSVF